MRPICAQRVLRQGPEVVSIDEIAPACGSYRAAQQAHEGGLARPRESHESDALTRRYDDRQAREDLLAVGVLEVYVAEFDGAVDDRGGGGVLRVRTVDHFVGPHDRAQLRWLRCRQTRRIRGSAAEVPTLAMMRSDTLSAMTNCPTLTAPRLHKSSATKIMPTLSTAAAPN